jgi:hypothetical protein
MSEDSGVIPEADDADEYEQTRDLVGESEDELDPGDRPMEANEADLMEQTRALPLHDEDDEPDE